LRAVKKQIVDRWQDLDSYRLELEQDVFRRLGEPAERAVKRVVGDIED